MIERYISPTGSHQSRGTANDPFATFAQAQLAVRGLVGRQEALTIHVADGLYYLQEPLRFEAADSGQQCAPVIYRAENEGKAIISGGVRLQPNWCRHNETLFKTTTPPGLWIDQLYANGIRQPMARYPNLDPNRHPPAWQGTAADAIAPHRIARWGNPAGGYLHAMHQMRWGGYHYRITGKNAQGELQYEGGWQHNRPTPMHPELQMVENIFEELDAPGEWFHDRENSTLYFYPPAGLDLATATFEGVRLAHLIEFLGTSAAPVQHLHLEGFTFRHTRRTFMENREPLLRSDWTIYRGGAVFMTGVKSCRISHCKFEQVGGNAIFINRYARDITISGCHLEHTGASGICFVGGPEAVRNPLFSYHQHLDPKHIDFQPGPQSDDYPSHSKVEDCLIHGIGETERQAAAVQISMAARIHLCHITIYDCSRAGVNIGDGTWGGHLLEGLDVFDTVLETHDHGSFNAWGRDRYWAAQHREISQPSVAQWPQLPYLDALEPTTIRNSRWRCDHGWDIDLDDGASNYQIYNNLLLSGGLKLREGYRRHVYNNVIIGNGLHPHLWFANSEDRFYHNIIMATHRGVQTPEAEARGEWVDKNLFYGVNPKDVAPGNHFGWDKNSLFADPLFVHPASGDFRVRESSPALLLGFKNFAMNAFGVRKSSLKQIARTPAIPQIATGHELTHTRPIQQWLGAYTRAIEGAEYSAFGVNQDEGGIELLDVPSHSMASLLGLRKGDLIQAINDEMTPSHTALEAVMSSESSPTLLIRYVRNQQSKTIDLKKNRLI